MSPVISTATPPARRHTQYTVERRFLRGSKLHTFLADKEPDLIKADKTEYTLFTVLSALRHVILREVLYDLNNTNVIMCSRDLEDALDMRSLHVTEIKDAVLTQMELLRPGWRPPTPPIACPPPTSSQNEGRQTNAGNRRNFNVEGRYWVRLPLLKVFSKVSGVNPKQVIYMYRDCTSTLSRYILDNKDKFFDIRNIKVAHVEGDLLGDAFDVKVFHRTQVTTLLRRQLVPVEENFIFNTRTVRPPARIMLTHSGMVHSAQNLSNAAANFNSVGLKRTHVEAIQPQQDEERQSHSEDGPSSSKKANTQDSGPAGEEEKPSVDPGTEHTRTVEKQTQTAICIHRFLDTDVAAEVIMDEFVPLPTDERPLSYEILMDEVHDVEFEPDSSSDEIDDSETVVEAESIDESGSEQLSGGQ